jgi:GTPase SAR1 family protein
MTDTPLTYVSTHPSAVLVRDLEQPSGDVGGQRSLRPYWRNYFEQTDAIVWVVDSGDRMRMGDCKEELHRLLLEDVRCGDYHFAAPDINITSLEPPAISRCITPGLC